MSIADTVRRLVEAGATPEVIAIAVEAIEQAGQKKPRSSAAERQARYEERKRQKASESVISDVRPGANSDAQNDASLPLPPSPQTPQPPTPSREIKPPIVPQADKPAGPSRRKPKRAIPDVFPTAELIAEQQAKARSVGANLDVANQAERFRNWSIGNDARYADWAATWRNWCDRAIKNAPKTAVAASQSRSAPSEADRWRRWLREYRLNGHWPSDDAGPRPGHPACRVPAALLAEFGHAPAPAANDHKLYLFAQGDAA
ncbi:hypothetical protein [Brevundimonas naejangsanensis]|uniref:hypothetical protein n=1 Tax=Brevundimonas naejangsanensis TaxID=588932 RepID=UPI0039F72B12